MPMYYGEDLDVGSDDDGRGDYQNNRLEAAMNAGNNDSVAGRRCRQSGDLICVRQRSRAAFPTIAGT